MGEILTRLREALYLSASEVARRADITQPTLSRWENGRGFPTAEQVAKLLPVLNADEATATRLRQLARGPEHRRVVLHRSEAHRTQREWRELERSATRIVTFTPTLVPGLLQTDGYAQALVGDALTDENREKWLAVRRDRRALVDDPGDRELLQITTAGALLWGLGGREVMRDQLAHLIDVAQRRTIRFGLVPPSADLGFHVLSGFDLYDTPTGRRVVVGTAGAVALYDDAGDIALHEDVLAGLERTAAWGAAAVPVLERLSEWMYGS